MCRRVHSADQLQGQTESLKKTNATLGRMENSAIPGADKLITMINKAEQKNKIIIAFVIALCLALLLYAMGVIDMLKVFLKSSPPVPSSSEVLKDSTIISQPVKQKTVEIKQGPADV